MAAFERMSARHWRATEEARLGGWLLRAAGGFTGRANSALPLGDPGMPAERAVAEVEAWYPRRGLPPMVVIATGLRTSTSSLDQLLAGRGWAVRQRPPAVVMTGRSEHVGYQRPEAALSLADEPDEDWLATYGSGAAAAAAGVARARFRRRARRREACGAAAGLTVATVLLVRSPAAGAGSTRDRGVDPAWRGPAWEPP